MSTYTVYACLAGPEIDTIRISEHGTFTAAMDACVDAWKIADRIHPDLSYWVESSKFDDKQFYPDDYCETYGS